MLQPSGKQLLLMPRFRRLKRRHKTKLEMHFKLRCRPVHNNRHSSRQLKRKRKLRLKLRLKLKLRLRLRYTPRQPKDRHNNRYY